MDYLEVRWVVANWFSYYKCNLFSFLNYDESSVGSTEV